MSQSRGSRPFLFDGTLNTRKKFGGTLIQIRPKKQFYFTNCNQNLLIFHKRIEKVRSKKSFAAHLERSHGTPVEKHWFMTSSSIPSFKSPSQIESIRQRERKKVIYENNFKYLFSDKNSWMTKTAESQCTAVNFINIFTSSFCYPFAKSHKAEI